MSNRIPLRRIRVYLREANRMATELLRQSLVRDRNLEIVHCGDSLAEVISARPDVAVISAAIEQQPLKGCDFVAELRQTCPTVRCVVLVDRPTPELILKACRVGARGIFGRNEPADLRKCIAAVYNGEIWMGQKVVELLVSAISNPLPVQVHNANGDALLSRREQDIVRWVAEGMTNRQIAEQSGLSEHTVKNYLFRIFEKLGVSTRVELVLYSMAQRNASPGENGDNGGHDDSLSISQWLTLPEKVPLAAYVVADLFRRGYGVERDARSAYKWIWIAETIAENAQGGNGAIRQQLEQELTAREVEEAKRAAAEWLRLHWSGEPPQSSAA